MDSSVQKKSGVKSGIEKLLLHINEITLQIKREQHMILELLRDDGPLHTAVDKANKKLILKAREMGIDVQEITSEIDNGYEMQLISPNIRTLLGFSEEITGSNDQNNAE